MAPMAQLTALLGARVTGSDRNFDRGLELPVFDGLVRAGVALVPQDGSGVEPGIDALIHSTAVESTNPDFARAEALGIERIRRGSFLSRLAAERRAVAIAGTSGKSTVTAMIAHILVDSGFDPSFLGGGAAAGLDGAFPPGSLRVGGSDWFVVETDESDGSVAEFTPAIATLTNLTRDHKEVDVTTELFARLLEQTRERAVLHVGDPALAAVDRPDHLPIVTVAVEGDPVWMRAHLVRLRRAVQDRRGRRTRSLPRNPYRPERGDRGRDRPRGGYTGRARGGIASDLRRSPQAARADRLGGRDRSL